MTQKPKSRENGRKGGRPTYKPSVEDRLVVEQMKFCGESDATIARSLGIDDRTMRKHFADELANGHANRRRQIVGLLFKSAEAGNVTAQKKLEEMGRVAGAAESVRRREEQAAPTRPKLGKKEELLLAAESVEGKFAPPEAPKLVVSNQ